jgi:hypothetical protein
MKVSLLGLEVPLKVGEVELSTRRRPGVRSVDLRRVRRCNQDDLASSQRVHGWHLLAQATLFRP